MRHKLHVGILSEAMTNQHVPGATPVMQPHGLFSAGVIYNRRKTSWKERAMSVERPCVLVGVTGCIAAYKAGEIVRGLQKEVLGF